MITKENLKRYVEITYDILSSYIPDEAQRTSAEKDLKEILHHIEVAEDIKEAELQFILLSNSISFQVGLLNIIHPEIAEAVTHSAEKFSKKGAKHHGQN